MASKKPPIHGRDHLPGGADPIPALTTLPSLPYGSLSQVFSGYTTTGHSQFYLTGHYLAYTNNADVFTYEDTYTALGVNVEGFYIVRATAIIFETGVTSDRNIEWEAWDGASWNGSGGGGFGPPSYITGQPTLAATPAGYFSGYKEMYVDTFIELSLDSVGAASLPIKIRPVLNINTPPNPMTFGLNIEAFRMGDVGTFT